MRGHVSNSLGSGPTPCGGLQEYEAKIVRVPGGRFRVGDLRFRV